MFRHEETICTWSAQQADDFCTIDNLKPVRQLMEDQHVFDSLPTIDQKWIQATARNIGMFLPVGMLMVTVGGPVSAWFGYIKWPISFKGSR